MHVLVSSLGILPTRVLSSKKASSSPPFPAIPIRLPRTSSVTNRSAFAPSVPAALQHSLRRVSRLTSPLPHPPNTAPERPRLMCHATTHELHTVPDLQRAFDIAPNALYLRRAAPPTAPAHAAVVRDRPPVRSSPHACHDHRLPHICPHCTIRTPSRIPNTRYTIAGVPSGCADRSASPTLPAPPPVRYVHPRCDVSLSTAASLPHSQYDPIAQHVPRPLTISGAASLTLPLASNILTAFPPSRLRLLRTGIPMHESTLVPSSSSTPLPSRPTLPDRTRREDVVAGVQRAPCNATSREHTGRAERLCVDHHCVCPAHHVCARAVFKARI
ncbi:hypothetical protein B0H13DRAFT_2372685 [Mycena leptocephala]|nr:hypothetical protein B0H13DRAFT_2372685 [Mycena leptocephala]